MYPLDPSVWFGVVGSIPGERLAHGSDEGFAGQAGVAPPAIHRQVVLIRPDDSPVGKPPQHVNAPAARQVFDVHPAQDRAEPGASLVLRDLQQEVGGFVAVHDRQTIDPREVRTPRTRSTRTAASPRMPLAEAKTKVPDFIAAGKTVKDAMALVGRSTKTYEYWRRNDLTFRNRVDLMRELHSIDVGQKREINASDFASFRERYLGMKTFPHQQQWIDLIEGKEPELFHPSIRYEPGDKNFILINCPPEHSKSITLSVDYPTYRICADPSERILLVSETQKRAKEFLYAVKQRLTHPRYADLQLAFGPKGGYKQNSDAWRDDYIYIGSELRDSPEKDPTIQAIGVGGQIYGARATLIVLDDVCVLGNAHQYENQIRWIQQEVLTRLGPNGRLIIAGTRVDALDLYRELKNPDRYPDGRSPWSYLAQPAVLEFGDKPGDWKTLWPRSDHAWPGMGDEPDEDKLYPRWSGKHLFRRRNLLDPKTWSMVYQQAEVSESAIFDPAKVRAAVNGRRTCGPLQKGNPHHRAEGMDGLYVVCSMDPAMAGDTGVIAYAADLRDQSRYVLEGLKMSAPTPQKIRDVIHSWTEKYRPQVWVIEKNAFQLFLTRDEEIRAYLASRGVTMREHYTGASKLDPDFGVASLAPLFDQGLIELPSTHNNEGTKALVEQLITWSPAMKARDLKQDLPMALWFAEIITREVLESRTMAPQRAKANKFVPRYGRRRQVVVDINEYMEKKEALSRGTYGVLPAV